MGNMCTFGRARFGDPPKGCANHTGTCRPTPADRLPRLRPFERHEGSRIQAAAVERADGRPVRSSALAVGTFTQAAAVERAGLV